MSGPSILGGDGGVSTRACSAYSYEVRGDTVEVLFDGILGYSPKLQWVDGNPMVLSPGLLGQWLMEFAATPTATTRPSWRVHVTLTDYARVGRATDATSALTTVRIPALLLLRYDAESRISLPVPGYPNWTGGDGESGWVLMRPARVPGMDPPDVQIVLPDPSPLMLALTMDVRLVTGPKQERAKI